MWIEAWKRCSAKQHGDVKKPEMLNVIFGRVVCGVPWSDRWQRQHFWMQSPDFQVWQEANDAISAYARSHVRSFKIAKITGEGMLTSTDETTTQPKTQTLGHI